MPSSSQPVREHQLRAIVRDGITRGLGAIGLAGVALIHTIDAPGHFTGGPDTYLGVMYVGLIASSLALAAGLIVSGDRRIWAATAALTVTVIVGFVLSRTTGLPGDSGDVGNWGEGLGIASLFVESVLVVLGASVYVAKRAGAAAHGAGVTRRGEQRTGMALVA